MLYNPRLHMISRAELQQRMLDSARNVFSVMADIVLEECHEGPDLQQDTWVTALISFEGTYHGVVALHCPESLARRTAAGLLCMAGEVDMQDLFDAMGEVVNILGGDLKLYLDRGGRMVRLTTPSVFVGEGEFCDQFLSNTETVACFMAAGDERLLIGVQVNSGG